MQSVAFVDDLLTTVSTSFILMQIYITTTNQKSCYHKIERFTSCLRSGWENLLLTRISLSVKLTG